MDKLAQPSAVTPELTVPAPEFTEGQLEFVQYLRTITRGGHIAAMAYELGCTETQARLAA